MPSIQINALERAHLPALRRILDRVELFPSGMVDDMASPFFERSAPHHWLVATICDTVVGFAYTEPERLTEGTFNLLAIATDPDVQQKGVATAIVAALEKELRAQGGRILLVETSSLDHYGKTRDFYRKRAFVYEACIRYFYTDGEHKLVFWKRL